MEYISEKAISPKRSFIRSFMALLKHNIEVAFSSVVNTQLFRVKLANDKTYTEYLGRLLIKMDILQKTIKNLPKIEMKGTPASINIQPISEDVINQLTQQLGLAQKVINQQKSERFPLKEVLQALREVESAVRTIRVEIPKPQEVRIPEFPKEISLSDSKEILKALKEVKKEIESLPKKFPDIEFPNKVEVANFPPQRIPTPVTHVSINSLRGFIKSRNITVTTTATSLPDEVLSNRRSMVVFNNSSATTVFIGGSDVTSSNGMPVPAQTYSSAVDAGPNMILYGITSSGTADVRVLETSDEASGK